MGILHTFLHHDSFVFQLLILLAMYHTLTHGYSVISKCDLDFVIKPPTDDVLHDICHQS